MEVCVRYEQKQPSGVDNQSTVSVLTLINAYSCLPCLKQTSGVDNQSRVSGPTLINAYSCLPCLTCRLKSDHRGVSLMTELETLLTDLLIRVTGYIHRIRSHKTRLRDPWIHWRTRQHDTFRRIFLSTRFREDHSRLIRLMSLSDGIFPRTTISATKHNICNI